MGRAVVFGLDIWPLAEGGGLGARSFVSSQCPYSLPSHVRFLELTHCHPYPFCDGQTVKGRGGVIRLASVGYWQLLTCIVMIIPITPSTLFVGLDFKLDPNGQCYSVRTSFDREYEVAISSGPSNIQRMYHILGSRKPCVGSRFPWDLKSRISLAMSSSNIQSIFSFYQKNVFI